MPLRSAWGAGGSGVAVGGTAVAGVQALRATTAINVSSKSFEGDFIFYLSKFGNIITKAYLLSRIFY
jgi:hypothetical protein